MSLERRNVSSHEPETQMCEIHFDIVRPHQKRLQSQLEGFFRVDCCEVLHLLQFRILKKTKQTEMNLVFQAEDIISSV